MYPSPVGAWGMPGARCTRSLACEINKAHERRHHRFTGFRPAFPAQWFYGLFRALPGERILVVTVTSGLKAQSNPVGLDVASASLAPATGVRTTRLCRPLKRRSSRALADRSRGSSRPATNDYAPDALASTASRPALVTTRDRPSVGRDGNGYRFDSSQEDTKIFLQRALDRRSGKTPTDLPV